MSVLITWLLYRAFVISVGLICIILGYKLLVKGIFDGGADITGAWDNNKKLIIRRASPGALLFIFGFGIISISIIHSKFIGSDEHLAEGASLSDNKNIVLETHSLDPDGKISVTDKNYVNISEDTENIKQKTIDSLDTQKETKEDASSEKSESRRFFSVQGEMLND